MFWSALSAPPIIKLYLWTRFGWLVSIFDLFIEKRIAFLQGWILCLFDITVTTLISFKLSRSLFFPTVPIDPISLSVIHFNRSNVVRKLSNVIWKGSFADTRLVTTPYPRQLVLSSECLLLSTDQFARYTRVYTRVESITYNLCPKRIYLPQINCFAPCLTKQGTIDSISFHAGLNLATLESHKRNGCWWYHKLDSSLRNAYLNQQYCYRHNAKISIFFRKNFSTYSTITHCAWCTTVHQPYSRSINVCEEGKVIQT